MKKNNIVIYSFIIILFNIGCSSDPKAIEILPDYNRIQKYKRHIVSSDLNYQYDENNNYTHFRTSTLFFEMFSSSDSLVIDDYTTNVTNAYITRWAFKFNPKSIIVYHYDNKMKFVQDIKVFQVDENKIIKRMQSYWKPKADSEKYLDGVDYIYHHDNNNLILIEGKRNESLSTNPITDWRKFLIYKDFIHFDHPFPTRGFYLDILKPELGNILYNKGYRFSEKGIKNFNLLNIDYDNSETKNEFNTTIQYNSNLEMEVKYYVNEKYNFQFDFFVSFYSLTN